MEPIIVIVGPTGVGKTKLSIELAKKLNAEIINGDSVAIYKRLDIGSAKPTKEEQQQAPHHLIDIKEVTEEYSVYDYQQDTRKKIEEITRKNKRVIIVGGTGLYIKALLYDYTFDDNNNKNTKLYDFKIIGLTIDRDKLYNIIDNRVDQMMEEGLLEEVKSLYNQKITTRALKTAIGYKELYDYLDNKTKLEEAIAKIKQNSRHYAKRQYTFFNNQFSDIVWYDIQKTSLEEITKIICKEQSK